ncbi:hypothetical protein [Comamonas sp. F1-6]|uniref:hypothetical protein n=1 Tax=Comamonas sp. F1-6 TaxID=673550 RepID=UPI0031DF3225
MATPATTERKAPARRRAPKGEHLSMAHPDLPDTSHPHFWLAAYLADLAEKVAIEHLRKKICMKVDSLTHLALNGADTLYYCNIHKSAQYVRDHGLLLYAWPGTKLFTNPEARH